jgi:hypothetical protein
MMEVSQSGTAQIALTTYLTSLLRPDFYRFTAKNKFGCKKSFRFSQIGDSHYGILMDENGNKFSCISDWRFR